MTETVREAAKRLAAPWLAKGYQARALHTYHDVQGNPLHYRLRLEHPDGEAAPDGRKVIRPFKLNGVGYVFGEPRYPAGKPLYNLHVIAAQPDALIWITEGEKDADRLVKLGAVATTSGGASSAEAADWSPLRGRRVCIFRDNDEAGKDYARRLSMTLAALECDVSTVDVEELGLPPKGGATEWLQSHENATLSDLEAVPRDRDHHSRRRPRRPIYAGRRRCGKRPCTDWLVKPYASSCQRPSQIRPPFSCNFLRCSEPTSVAGHTIGSKTTSITPTCLRCWSATPPKVVRARRLAAFGNCSDPCYRCLRRAACLPERV